MTTTSISFTASRIGVTFPMPCSSMTFDDFGDLTLEEALAYWRSPA